MNSKMKRRMLAVGGVIVIVIVVLLAVVGGASSAKVVTVSEAASGSLADRKIQVTGTVVDNSYAIDADGVLTFSIQPEAGASDAGQNATLTVSYDKGVSATFGNGISAVCTGRTDANGVLQCTELVTKCPSKYENASSALTVGRLFGYEPETMVGKTVKVAGTVKPESLADATAATRLVIEDAETGATLDVVYTGALSSEVADGAPVVITGALDDKGSFLATNVALEG